MLILKQLRRKKNINQTDLAVAIGVSLRTIQLYEKKDANIPIKNLTKIAQYFELTVAELYRMELAENEGLYDIERTHLNNNNEFRTLSTGKFLATVPLITEDVHEAYVTDFDNDDFLLKRPRTSFIMSNYEIGQYIAFEIANKGMDNGQQEGISANAVLLCRHIPQKQLSRVLEKQQIFIIVYTSGILCKEILDINEKEGTITCHSFNPSPEYADFTIAFQDIKQLFVVLKKEVTN